MDLNIKPPMPAEAEDNLMQEQVTPPEPSIEFESETPKLPRKKLIIATLIVLVIAIVVAGVFFAYQSSNSLESDGEVADRSFVQKISDTAKTILPGSSPEPSATTQPESLNTTFDDIINSGGYDHKDIEYQNNDGSKLENDNLKIVIPGSQSNRLIKSVRASDTKMLYPIYLQNPTFEALDKLASQLGIQAKATKPDSYKDFYVEYTDPEAKLTYDPSGGTLYYEAKPGEGSLPSFAQAEDIARSLMQTLGIPLDNHQAKVVSSSSSSSFDNFSTVKQAIAVNFLRQHQGSPIVFSDLDHFISDAEGNSLSPEITIIITGGGKVSRIAHGSYSQRLAQTPISMNDRSLEQAIDELKTYGGHIRNIIHLEDQRTYFACADNRCVVHDATITKAYQGYYWNSLISGLSFYEINNNDPRVFDYLIPVWIFEGTGMMDKARTDETGKLIPNPDKSNDEQYYSQKVKFTSTVPAFSQTNESNLLRVHNYSLSQSGPGQAKVNFETRYLFPTFSGDSFEFAEPRVGIKYRLLVLFPDKTYSIINGYKQEIYPGEITLDIGDVKGEITTYLELADFSNLIEKRTLTVE